MRKIPALMVLNNETRWGSTYDIIKSAIKNRERLTIYMNQTPDLAEDRLSEQDWEDLSDMMMMLKPFKDVTLMGQKKNSFNGSIVSTL